MALEYEIRQEYANLPLTELLDAPVAAFQGVGDNQSEILERVFGLRTVRQLARFGFFLSSLGVQELALQGGEAASKPVGELSREQQLKFAVRSTAEDKSPKDLLKGPVHDLRGLTPAQDMALYDAFRVTNVVQLAHNRIMLEARVIDYLSTHPEEGGAALQGSEGEIASILGTGADWAKDTASAAEPQGEAALQQMTGELTEHVRGRLESLRDRARERAAAIPARGTASREELAEDAARVRQGGGGAGRSDALQESRRRISEMRGAGAVERPESSAAGRAAELSARREALVGSRTTGVAEQAERGEAAAGGQRPSAAPPPSTPPPARPSPYSTPRPSVAALRTAEQAAAEAEAAEAAAAEPSQAAEPPAPPPRLNPWLWVAAAVLAVVVVGAMVVLLRGPAEMEQAAAPAPTAEAGMGVSPASQPVAAVAPEPPPPPPVKAIHEVQRGQSLWRISRRYYDTPLKWPNIFRANEDQIRDPDLIFPNQQFRIPPD